MLITYFCLFFSENVAFLRFLTKWIGKNQIKTFFFVQNLVCKIRLDKINENKMKVYFIIIFFFGDLNVN
jgi:hypothetical protein